MTTPRDTEIPTGHVTASVYRVPNDALVDLIVNPADAVSTQEAVDRHPAARRFRVIQSDAIAPGRMVAVDKLGVLTGLEDLDR